MVTRVPDLPIAVQMYTLRTLPESFSSVLARIAALGYTGIETLGDHGLSAGEMRAHLDQHGLQVAGSHIELDDLQADFGSIVAFNRAIGNDSLVIAFIPALRRASTAHAFQEMGKLLGDLAERCRAEGMRLHYHNHHFEFALLDGRYALDWLFDAAGPYLSFEPDLAWVAAAGVDPVALLRRFSGRCPLIHAKDLAPSGERPEDAVMDGFVMSDVGHGTLDWSTLLPATRVAGAEWYIVEHDNPRDPMGSITRSLAYLRGVLPDVLD